MWIRAWLRRHRRLTLVVTALVVVSVAGWVVGLFIPYHRVSTGAMCSECGLQESESHTTVLGSTWNLGETFDTSNSSIYDKYIGIPHTHTWIRWVGTSVHGTLSGGAGSVGCGEAPETAHVVYYSLQSLPDLNRRLTPEQRAAVYHLMLKCTDHRDIPDVATAAARDVRKLLSSTRPVLIPSSPRDPPHTSRSSNPEN